MMSLSDRRPASSIDQSCVDIKKFISYLKGEEQTSETTTIPVSFTESITEKIKALSPIKALAKLTYTSSDRLDVVVEEEDTDQSGWIANDEIKILNGSKISKISINLYQLFAKPKVAQSLLDDCSIKVEEFVNEKITSQMAARENKAFLFGNGENQPKGILSYGFSTEGPKANMIEAVESDEIGKITNYKHLITLMEKLPSKYLGAASWIMSRNAASHIRCIVDETTKKFVWQNSIALGIPDTLLGYPVVICDDMPKVSENEKIQVPVLFANLYEGYQIAEKPQMSILKDPYNSKPFVEFYATKRIGGDVINFNAIKALLLRPGN